MKENIPFPFSCLGVTKIVWRAAEFIQENTQTDIVDINMGCPVNKIVKNEAGANGSKIQKKSIPLSIKFVLF